MLSQLGYFSFEEDQEIRPRVMIRVQRRELEDYTLTAQQTTLIEELMREYTGVFTELQYVKGDEAMNKKILVGFALETHDEQANAERKLQSKNLDMIVLNSLQDSGAGFGVDTNKVTLIYANGTKKDLPLLMKQEVADAIIDGLVL